MQTNETSSPIRRAERRDARQSRLRMIDANQPVIAAIMALATP
jgi:hypothetical protein